MLYRLEIFCVFFAHLKKYTAAPFFSSQSWCGTMAKIKSPPATGLVPQYSEYAENRQSSSKWTICRRLICICALTLDSKLPDLFRKLSLLHIVWSLVKGFRETTQTDSPWLKKGMLRKGTLQWQCLPLTPKKKQLMILTTKKLNSWGYNMEQNIKFHLLLLPCLQKHKSARLILRTKLMTNPNQVRKWRNTNQVEKQTATTTASKSFQEPKQTNCLKDRLWHHSLKLDEGLQIRGRKPNEFGFK